VVVERCNPNRGETTKVGVKVAGHLDRVRRSPSRKDMAVILRDTPASYDWGWFSREEQRMHLQLVDKDHCHLHYKVWLESKGRRVFDPEPGIPGKVLKTLANKVAETRERIEAYWAAFMIKNGW